MKKSIILLISILTLLLFTVSGCSDFEFNPIGTWNSSEQRLYADGELMDTTSLENGTQVSLVFKKSGTGYIDAGTDNKHGFTYTYDSKEVSITRTDTPADPRDGHAVYQVENGGSSLLSVQEFDTENENGKTVHCRYEVVFKRQ